jgi:methyl-accepting chemotaxis protein
MDLLQYGIAGAILAAMLALVRIAIGAERRRADDWRTAAQTTAAANEVLSSHVGGLVASVQKLTESVGKLIDSAEKQADSQQETLALLRKLDRSAA